MNEEEDELYATARVILGRFIGKKLLDVSQHDADEYKEEGAAYVYLLFEDGLSLKFPIDDEGFDWSQG